MFDRDKWKEIWSTIRRNKTRSVLTAFGVFWGLFMFMLLVGFGNGFRHGMSEALDGFSVNSCFFYARETSEPYRGNKAGRRWWFSSKDLDLVSSKVPGIAGITPLLTMRSTLVRGMAKASFDTRGVMPFQFEIEKMEVVDGRLLNRMDVNERRKVCNLSKQIAETLFAPGEDPVGQTIRIDNANYTVVGVIKPRASMVYMGSNPHYTTFVPYTTLQMALGGADRFWFMALSSKPGYDLEDIEKQVTELLKDMHDISPTDEKGLGSINAMKQMDMIDNVFGGVNLLIWVVGLGALLSGMIGISNIMLVTVRERMREIGIRRALGAKPRAIASQIMSESLVLTSVAGLAGFIFGTLILIGLRAAMSGGVQEGLSIAPYVSFDLALAAMGILVVSGLLTGLMPTWKALKIKAIDAIRDE